MRLLPLVVAGWVVPLLAVAQPARAPRSDWVVPASATKALKALLHELRPELEYRNAIIEDSVATVQACPPGGDCFSMVLSHPSECEAPVGPFCVAYPGRAVSEEERAIVARAFEGAATDTFWVFVRAGVGTAPSKSSSATGGARGSSSGAKGMGGGPSSRGSQAGGPQDDRRPRPTGVPAPWAIALALALSLGWAGWALGERAGSRPLLRWGLPPVLLLGAAGVVAATGLPLLWELLFDAVFFSAVFVLASLGRARSLPLVAGIVVLFCAAELLGRVRGGQIGKPERTAYVAGPASFDPVLDGHLAPLPDAAGACAALADPGALLPEGPGRAALHVVGAEGGLASLPALGGGRVVAVPGGPDVRFAVARALVSEHRPSQLAFHLSAGEDLRSVGMPLPCCGDRAPVDFGALVPRVACSEQGGAPAPARLTLLAARSREPQVLTTLGRISVLAAAADRKLTAWRRSLRAAVPGPPVAAARVAAMLGALRRFGEERGTEVVVVLEPDLEAFLSPTPEWTAAALAHEHLGRHLARAGLVFVDLWRALDRAVEDGPRALADRRSVTPQGRVVLESALRRVGLPSAPMVGGAGP